MPRRPADQRGGPGNPAPVDPNGGRWLFLKREASAAELKLPPLASFTSATPIGFPYWQDYRYLAAREDLEKDELPQDRMVGTMAMRQYDYHSFVEAAQPLLQRLYQFDEMVKQRADCQALAPAGDHCTAGLSSRQRLSNRPEMNSGRL